MSAFAVMDWFVLAYFVLVNTFYALLIASAGLELRRHRRQSWGQDLHALVGSEVAPRLSVLAPAYDEGATVAQSVRALLTLAYPDLEVVLVNDGSTDDTMEVLERGSTSSPSTRCAAARSSTPASAPSTARACGRTSSCSTRTTAARPTR